MNDGACDPLGRFFAGTIAPAYLVDSGPSTITAYKYDLSSGQFGVGRPLVDRPLHGTFDGLTVDSEGCLWVAVWNGSCVQRYSSHGALLAPLPTSVTRPTSVCLGAHQLRTLFVTSARQDGADGQLDGCVLRAPVPAPGLPSTPYAGPAAAGALHPTGTDAAAPRGPRPVGRR